MDFNRDKQESEVKATPEEQELNKLDLELRKELQPQMIDVNKQGLNLSQLLLGGQSLPGYLESLPGGISEEAIANQATELTKKNMTNFQSLGLADSGVAFRETSEDIANNLLFPAEQFNLQNLLQLLNLGVGSSAQTQTPVSTFGGQLSQRLQGLRSQEVGTTPSFMTRYMPILQAGAQAAGAAAAGCWVASEIYGGWNKISTIKSRYYINFLAPKWFKKFYLTHGESIARFISDKPLFKAILKPLFNWFGNQSMREGV